MTNKYVLPGVADYSASALLPSSASAVYAYDVSASPQVRWIAPSAEAALALGWVIRH